MGRLRRGLFALIGVCKREERCSAYFCEGLRTYSAKERPSKGRHECKDRKEFFPGLGRVVSRVWLRLRFACNRCVYRVCVLNAVRTVYSAVEQGHFEAPIPYPSFERFAMVSARDVCEMLPGVDGCRLSGRWTSRIRDLLA